MWGGRFLINLLKGCPIFKYFLTFNCQKQQNKRLVMIVRLIPYQLIMVLGRGREICGVPNPFPEKPWPWSVNPETREQWPAEGEDGTRYLSEEEMPLRPLSSSRLGATKPRQSSKDIGDLSYTALSIPPPLNTRAIRTLSHRRDSGLVPPVRPSLWRGYFMP